MTFMKKFEMPEIKVFAVADVVATNAGGENELSEFV